MSEPAVPGIWVAPLRRCSVLASLVHTGSAYQSDQPPAVSRRMCSSIHVPDGVVASHDAVTCWNGWLAGMLGDVVVPYTKAPPVYLSAAGVSPARHRPIEGSNVVWRPSTS